MAISAATDPVEVVEVDTATLKKVSTGAALQDAEKAAVEQDVKLFRSSHISRRILVSALVAANRKPEHLEKPDEGECREFYDSMMSYSRQALASQESDIGLTEADKALLLEANPDCGGMYSIGPLLDRQIPDSAFPAFLTESGKKGKLSIRRYQQQQEGRWLKSVKTSLTNFYASLEMATGGAQAQTKSHCERQVADLRKIIKRHKDADENTETALLVKEFSYLEKIVKRLEDEGKVAKPAPKSK